MRWAGACDKVIVTRLFPAFARSLPCLVPSIAACSLNRPLPRVPRFAAGSYFVSESPAQESRSANERVSVALMGANGRGGQLAKSFLAQTNTEIGYICDVDERVIDRMTTQISKGQERKPTGVGDFRQALDDKNIDVLVVAAPNHWHCAGDDSRLLSRQARLL